MHWEHANCLNLLAQIGKWRLATSTIDEINARLERISGKSELNQVGGPSEPLNIAISSYQKLLGWMAYGRQFQLNANKS